MSANAQSVLVTGATGFLGSRLTRALVADGVDVAIVTRQQSSLDQLGDAAAQVTSLRHDGTTDQLREFFADTAPQVVFHLAANFIGVHTSDDVEPLIADNVGFTAQVCEAMVTSGSRHLIAAGTVWQHANSPAGEMVPTPNSLYAATKQAAEDIIAYYAGTGTLSSVVLKIYDSYGPGDPRPKLLNVLSAKAAAGEALEATSGAQQLHLVHVDDIVTAFRAAGESLAAGTLNGHQSFTLPSDKAVSLKELVATWREATGRQVDVAWGARPDRPGEILVPWEGPALPGWQAKIPLLEGLKTLSDA